MAVLMLVLDIVYGVLHEVISLFPVGRSTAIATVVCFGLAGFFTVVMAGVFFVLFLEYYSHLAVFSWFLHLLLVCMYYYGKNINNILLRYGDELGCDNNCQEVNQDVALFFLTLSVLILTSLIPHLHRYIKKKCCDTHHTYWHYFYGTVLIFIHVNAIYAAASLALINNQCTKAVLALSTVMLILVTLGWYNIWVTKDLWKGDSCDSINESESSNVLCWSTYLHSGSPPSWILAV